MTNAISSRVKTDAEHDDPSVKPAISDVERDYLIDFASNYFAKPITVDDIVWTYSGVRPLYDDGAATAAAATRDYVLKLNTEGAPLLNIFGGKITTYRKLAEHAMEKLSHVMQVPGEGWTAGVTMPGGDFAVAELPGKIASLRKDYPFLTDRWAQRLIRAYGTDAWSVLGDAAAAGDLGEDFGATLTAREVGWLIENEYVHSAEDVIWRRSKLGLRLTEDQIKKLSQWIDENRENEAAA